MPHRRALAVERVQNANDHKWWHAGGGRNELKQKTRCTRRETQQQPAVTRQAEGTVSTTSLATRPGYTHRKKKPPRHAENSDVSPPLTYALLTASRRSAPRLLLAFALPLPFCHAVYQDRLRKDVKKMIAVATVPFLSLISFQRCLFPRLGVAGAPGAALTSLARCLHGAAAAAGAGVGVDIRGRQRDAEGGRRGRNKTLSNTRVNSSDS